MPTDAKRPLQLNDQGQLRHFLSLDGLPRELLTELLDTADSFLEVGARAVKKVPLLRGKTVCNVFFENSTRTRTTFELAAQRLSADVITLNVSTSSTSKGETLFDTASQSILPSIVDKDRLAKANGRLYAVELVMNQFVGPPLGGVLIGISVPLVLGGSVIGYALAAVGLTLVTGTFRPERSGPPTRLTTDIAEGLRYLWHHRVLRTLAIMVGVLNLASTAAFAVVVLYAVSPGPMGLSEAGFGILLTTFAIGSLLGSFVGSIIVGFIYNFGQALLPELAYFVLFLPMLLVLIFRPQGLFGRHVP